MIAPSSASRISRISGRTSITLLNAAILGLYFVSLISWQEQVHPLQLVTFLAYLSLALYCGRDLTDKSPDPALRVSRGSLLGAPVFGFCVYLLSLPDTALLAALMSTLSLCLWLGLLHASDPTSMLKRL